MLLNYDFVTTAAAVAVIYTTVKFFTYMKTRQVESDLIKKHGCQPAQAYPNPWGMGIIKEIASFAEEKKLPMLVQHRLMQYPETNTVCASVLGTKNHWTNHPENIKAIMATQFDSFIEGREKTDFGMGILRRRVMGPLIGHGIFTDDGASWEVSRALLRPSFDRKYTSNLPELEGHVQRLIERIKSTPTDTQGFRNLDIEPLLSMLTLDATTKLLFGRSTETLAKTHDAEQEAFVNAWKTALELLIVRWKTGVLASVATPKEFWDSCRIVHRFADTIIDEALTRRSAKKTGETPEQSSPYVFLEALIEQTQDREVLRSQALNMLLAGRETMSALMSWSFFTLRKDQRVRGKLLQLVEKQFGLGTNAKCPTYQDLQDFRYMTWFLREILRLYCPVTDNGRECINTTVLPRGGGKDGKSPLLIRKGETVNYSVYALHRSKQLYGDNAEEFWPERWGQDAPREGLRTIGWGYIPFGGGPRICLGQKLTLTDAAYVITRFLQIFPEIEAAPNPSYKEEEVLFRVGMTMNIDSGVWMRF